MQAEKKTNSFYFFAIAFKDLRTIILVSSDFQRYNFIFDKYMDDQTLKSVHF